MGNYGLGNNNESITFTQIPNFTNTMEISAGDAYTAIAKQDGTVWGFGDINQGDENFESQTNSNIPVQIGAENFKIEPKKATMYINDTEDLIQGLEIKEFNLFYTRQKSQEDYEWETSNEAAVEVENGNLTAKAVGVATITATDKITGTKKQIERIVINHETDRIEKLSINTHNADIEEECKYKIVIEEKDKNGQLTITTKDKTDKISLDKTNWSSNGTLTETLDIQDKETEMPFYIQTQNGTVIEYLLTIYVKSNDTSLEYIKVNGLNAIKQEDGTYYIHIDALGEVVSINAKATEQNANVRIESENYEKQETTKTKLIDAKETNVNIFVKAEDGTVQKYTLLVSGLPDDATLAKVIINGEQARYIEGQNKYQIRLSADIYNIEAIATDSLAKISINEKDPEASSQRLIITKTADKTVVKIKVTAQNRIDTGEYTLEITQKSNDNTLSYITVNGKNAKEQPDGSYRAEVSETVQTAEIKIGATDELAIVYLDGETENRNNITVIKTLIEEETIYEIKVVAENGQEAKYLLTIKKLSANTNIEKIEVTTTKETIDEETGAPLALKTTEEATMQEDGNYYLKINREEEAKVKVTLEDKKASVKIESSDFKQGTNTKEVATMAEKTEVQIQVKAEDGTIRECLLILDKKLNDAELKEIISDDIQKQEKGIIYVDENLDKANIIFVTNSEFASIKLLEEENFEPKQMTREIELNKALAEGEERQIIVVIQAEDGSRDGLG